MTIVTVCFLISGIPTFLIGLFATVVFLFIAARLRQEQFALASDPGPDQIAEDQDTEIISELRLTDKKLLFSEVAIVIGLICIVIPIMNHFFHFYH